MALAYKTGSQKRIDFIVCSETRPAGVILSGVKRQRLYWETLNFQPSAFN